MADLTLLIQVSFERLWARIIAICRTFMQPENIRLAYALVAGFIMGSGLFALIFASQG